MSGSGRESQERQVLFPGYGDRVGSGVELAPNVWKGGEVVTDAETVKKALNSIKPRRFFYSPIGDGVVAADGVEMKRPPPDLTPRVTVIQQRTVEKGPPGKAGVRVIEKEWTTGGGGSSGGHTAFSNEGLGSAPDTGRSSRATTAPSPLGDLADSLKDLGMGGPQPASGPGSGLGGPGPSQYQPQQQAPAAAAPPPIQAPVPATKPAQDPYGSLGSNRSSLPSYDGRIKSPSNGLSDNYGRGPDSGRTSTTSALFSEPGMRYEIKKDYLVTNPRELIHQYATTTPIQSIPGYESLPGGGTLTQTIKESYSSTTEEFGTSFGPFPPYHAGGAGAVNPKKFVRQLRDDTMTHTQRAANQNTQSLNTKDQSYQHKIEEVRRQSNRISPNPEVDSLTNRLLTGLQSGQQRQLGK